MAWLLARNVGGFVAVAGLFFSIALGKQVGDDDGSDIWTNHHLGSEVDRDDIAVSVTVVGITCDNWNRGAGVRDGVAAALMENTNPNMKIFGSYLDEPKNNIPQEWQEAGGKIPLELYKSTYTTDTVYDAVQDWEEEFPSMKKLRIYYLCLPSFVVPGTVEKIKASHFKSQDVEVRIMIEKPIGQDLGSAMDLGMDLRRMGVESEELWMVDHFVGYPMLALMESKKWRAMSSWLSARRNFAEVLISATEARGVGGRIKGFMHKVGTVRDMMQSHMLQMMAIAMLPDPEASTTPVDEAKFDVLLNSANDKASNVLGQYERYVDDWMAEGVTPEEILQAIQEKGDTTYARMTFLISGGDEVSRFADGPGITLESGKALAGKRKYIKYTATGGCEIVINIAGAERELETGEKADRWISMTELETSGHYGMVGDSSCDEFRDDFTGMCSAFGREFMGMSPTEGEKNWFDQGRAGDWCAIGDTGLHEAAYGNIFAGVFRGERNLFLNLKMHLAQWRLVGDSLDPPADKVGVYPQCKPSATAPAEICPKFFPDTLEEHTKTLLAESPGLEDMQADEEALFFDEPPPE